MGTQIIIPDDFPSVLSGTGAEDKLRTLGQVSVYRTKAETRAELLERIQEAEVLINIRAYTRLGRKMLEACRGLRLISVWGTGTDNVDLKAAEELGITVANTPGANALAVAEHTLALLLSLARKIPFLDREIRKGKWPRVEMVQMSGKILGLVGLGAVARYLTPMAKGIGMKVIAWTLHPSPERAKEAGIRWVSKEQLLREADVVSLHLRLSERTRNFITREDFSLMRPSTFFVNTARAGLVEPGALHDALRAGKIAGAALDVFNEEPLPLKDPIIDFPNVVLTPHNAWMTPETIQQGMMMAVENVAFFLEGKTLPPERVVVMGRR